MFFPRLRRQAKWMFIALALVFAVGFVGFGVGSGSTGIGDLFSNGRIFGLGGPSSSGGPSVSKAQQAIAAHPDRPQGYRDLATAYEAQKQNDLAIAALVKYTTLRPKDQDALRELAVQALRKGTGARALRGLLERMMLDVMYDVPNGEDILAVKITRAVVQGESKPHVRRKQDQAAA